MSRWLLRWLLRDLTSSTSGSTSRTVTVGQSAKPHLLRRFVLLFISEHAGGHGHTPPEVQHTNWSSLPPSRANFNTSTYSALGLRKHLHSRSCTRNRTASPANAAHSFTCACRLCLLLLNESLSHGNDTRSERVLSGMARLVRLQRPFLGSASRCATCASLTNDFQIQALTLPQYDIAARHYSRAPCAFVQYTRQSFIRSAVTVTSMFNLYSSSCTPAPSASCLLSTCRTTLFLLGGVAVHTALCKSWNTPPYFAACARPHMALPCAAQSDKHIS